MEVKIGDIIKSYDFRNVKDCYMIGKVIELEGDFIICETMEVMFSGRPKKITKTFRTPKMGCIMTDDEFQRIEILS